MHCWAPFSDISDICLIGGDTVTGGDTVIGICDNPPLLTAPHLAWFLLTCEQILLDIRPGYSFLFDFASGKGPEVPSAS